jgi:tellurite methyltransferase
VNDGSIPIGARHWEERYRNGPRGAFFGEEPSTLARRLVHFFRHMDVPVQGDLFEIGCGEGRDVAFLAAQGFRVEAIEAAPTGVARTRELIRAHGLRAEVEEGDLARIAWRRDYDVLFANQAIQFAGGDALRVLEEVRDHTRPGGWNAIGMFTDEVLPPAEHPQVHIFHREELRRLYDGWRLLEYGESLVYSPRRDAYLSFGQIIARRP